MAEHHGFFADPRTWVAIAFTIFFVIFGKLMVTFVLRTLDKRAAVVAAELAEAARLRLEAEAMLADASRQREAAVAEASRMIEQARADAARLAQEAADEAKAAAGRRERMALDRISAAEKAAVTDVRMAAIEVAGASAARLIRDGVDPGADSSLIDHAIAGLPAALARRP